MRPDPRSALRRHGPAGRDLPARPAILRELAGGGVLQLPVQRGGLVNADTRADMERYVQSPGVPAEERVKLFKLAWDVIGSEFAGRHQQYEMFYAGAPFVVKGYAYRNYGYDEPLGAVEAFLACYGLSDRNARASEESAMPKPELEFSPVDDRSCTPACAGDVPTASTERILATDGRLASPPGSCASSPAPTPRPTACRSTTSGRRSTSSPGR